MYCRRSLWVPLSFSNFRLAAAPLALTLAASVAFGQQQQQQQQQQQGGQQANTPATATTTATNASAGVVDDWTTHHVVFSNPAGLPYYEQQQILNDLRYRMQQAKRAKSQQAAAVAAQNAALSSLTTAAPLASTATATATTATESTPTAKAKKGPKGTLTKDWSQSLGSTSNTWVGTVASPLTSSNILSTSTFTMDGVTISASAPKAATVTGTFSSWPTSSSTPSITVNSGSTLITVTNNGSAQSETLTFTGLPLTTTSLKIPTTGSSTNNLTLTTSATAAVLLGSVPTTSPATPAANTTFSLTAGTSSPGATVTLTNGSTAATDTGTFSAAASTKSAITINNGTSTYSFTPGGAGQSVMGSVLGPATTATTITATVGGTTYTATTNSTSVSNTGTFTAPISSTTPITLNNGTNTFTFTPNGTGATATGTVAGPATSSTAAVVVTSGLITYNATTNATAGNNVTGTLSNNGGHSASGTFTIKDGLGNTINAAASTSAGSCSYNSSTSTYSVNYAQTNGSTGQASAIYTAFHNCTTITPAPAYTVSYTSGNNSFTVSSTYLGDLLTFTGGGGSTSFAWSVGNGGTNGATAGSAGCTLSGNIYTVNFQNSPSTTTLAGYIAAGFNACSGTTNTLATTTVSGSTVTLQTTIPGAQATVGALTVSGGTSGVFTWTTAANGGSNGSNSCNTSTGAATFANASTANLTTLASNLATAINDCTISGFATVPTPTSGSLTVSTIPGTTTLAVNTTTTPGYTWSNISSQTGSAGSNSCSGGTVHFANSLSTSTLASNIETAFSACATITGTYNSPNTTFTIASSVTGTTTAVGTQVSGLNSAISGVFSWGAVTNGTDASGPGTCTGNSNTFVNSSAIGTAATNLAAAINACGISGLAATTANTPASGNVTVSTTATGSSATFTVNASAPQGFTWAKYGAVTGSAGSNTCSGTSGTYAAASGTTLISNLVTAFSGCTSGLGVTVAQGGSNGTTTSQIVVTETTPGAFTTLSGATANSSSSIFAWGTATPGTQGSNSCSGTTGTFGTGTTATDTTTVAANLAAAITACNPTYASTVLASATSSSNVVTIKASINGTFVLTTPTGTNASMVTIGTPSAGSNGTTACTGSGPYTATFATASSLTTVATNLASAVNACGSSGSGVTGSGSGVVTASVPGTGFTLTVGASNNTGVFTWSTVTPGSDGTTSGTTFAYWSLNTYVSPTQVATNIATAINTNSTLGSLMTATASTGSGSTGVVTVAANGTTAYTVTISGFSALTGATKFSGGASTTSGVLPNALPAKFGSVTTASCSDWVIYPTGSAGSATAASIVAYNNLYVGTGTGACTTANPSVYFAYNTGGTVTTSPIISVDGTQVAFVQMNGSVASLVVLRPAASGGAVSAPAALTLESPASAYPGCTAPCYTTVQLTGASGGTVTDTLSSPYYDPASDTVYVGDDSGYLHKITGVFTATPTEQLSGTSAWARPSTSAKLTSPVYDSGSTNVFVGDMAGVLHSVSSTTAGSFTSSGTLGSAIVDAPLVDSTAGKVYVFVSSTTNAVEQFNTTGSLTASGTITLGTGGTGYYQYDGAFDNSYYQSTNQTGNLWVVGNTGAAGNPTLYQLSIINNVMYRLNGATTSTSGSAFGWFTGLSKTQYGWPSAATEFCNGACAAHSTTGCSVNLGSPGANVNCGNGFFSGADLYAPISGTNIPAGSIIVAYSAGDGSVTLNNQASGATSGNSVTVGSTPICIVTGGSTSVTCNFAFFSAANVGATIAGVNIPTGTTIAAVNTSNSVTMSAAATGTANVANDEPITVGGISSGNDYLFFSVNMGNVSGCTATAGNGCVLAYNITNIYNAGLAGTGLNIVDNSGTNSCWSTGGMIIDNDAITTGASQIYFVNLNGSASSGAPSQCGTPGSPGILQGVQTTQSNP